MSQKIQRGGFALGRSSLGLPVCIQVLHHVRGDTWHGIGQFGPFKGREVRCSKAFAFTEADVLTFDDPPRSPGARIGYIEDGEFKTATGPEADRIYAERSS